MRRRLALFLATPALVAAMAVAVAFAACAEYDTAEPGSSSSSSSSSSTSSSSGSSTSSSSSSSSSSTSSSGGSVDSGTDAATKFCEAAITPAALFCSDFTEPPNPLGAGRWTAQRLGSPQGTITFEGAADQPERHARFVVAPGSVDFPSTGLVWTGPASSSIQLNQTLTVRQKLKVNPGTSTYAEVAIIRVGNALRGLAVNACANGPGVCLTENDGFGDGTSGVTNDVLAPGTTIETEVSITRKPGGAWASTVGRAGRVLNMRATGGLPNGSEGTISVVIGAANTGGNGLRTDLEVDDVVVTVTGP